MECVKTLHRIARRIEEEGHLAFDAPALLEGEKINVLKSAVLLANQIPNSSLLTFTRRGFMATSLAALRPTHAPIFAMTNTVQTQRQLCLLRGVMPYVMPLTSDPNDTIENAVRLLLRENMVKPGDKLIVVTDIISRDRLVDSVQLRTVH